jgi:hypothetical protein
MPKPATTPVIIDSLRCLSIKMLKSRGLLQKERTIEGEITWNNSITKELSASVGFEIETNTEKPYIRLNYSIEKKNFNYPVYLVKIPSNLGKGCIWYFICPDTGNRCLKLYLNDEYFISRVAVRKEGGVYSSELVPKSARYGNLDFKRTRKLMRQVLETQKSYAKSHYRGRKTKRQVRTEKAGRKLMQMGMMGVIGQELSPGPEKPPKLPSLPLRPGKARKSSGMAK